jgi:DNA-binding CsgD family transcriptional regulator
LSAQPSHYASVPAGCPLTSRQFEVATLLAAGATYKEIALRLGITPSTVTSHAHMIYHRLGIIGRGAAPAAVRMKDSGWLGAPPRAPRLVDDPLTPTQRAYVHHWDRLASERTPRAAALVEVASIMLLGDHRLAPDRPPARPDIDTLLLRIARGVTRPIAT